MTCPQSNAENHKLHARLAALQRDEAAAGSRFDAVDLKRAAMIRTGRAICAQVAERFDQADAEYDAVVEARTEIENVIVGAPIESRVDVVAKLRILVRRSDSLGEADMSDAIEQLADRVIDFSKRRSAN